MGIDISKYTAHLHPGKFEGEIAATEYFYEQMCNGDGERFSLDVYGMDDEPSAELFKIDAKESEAFSLPLHSWFLLREDSQGFALGSVHPTREDAEAKFKSWIGG